MRNVLMSALLIFCAPLWAATEVKLAVHDSFELPKEVLAQFEAQHNAKLTIIKMGDGNAMLNRLIITRGRTPLADAVYGLDNANLYKAMQSDILAFRQPESLPTVVSLPKALPVDYGFIAINYDKKWFAEKKLPLPKTLEDLAKPAYKNLLVMPNPGTSTPGLGFLLANIGGLGEEKTFAWWAAMRKNGVKVTQGWSDAYYTEFSLNGGSRPLMVGYASSPAADVFFSEGKLKTSRMGNLFLAGGSFLQIEGAAVLKGTKQPELAGQLVRFLQSAPVQQNMFTSMWVYPAVKETQHPPAIVHASVPKTHYAPNPERIAAHQKEWVGRWIKVVLK